MDLKKAKALLADYYEGQTSKEEETLLKRFFSGSEVPSEMEADRLLFLSLIESSAENIPDPHFDEKLFDAIEEMEQKKSRKVNVRNMIITLSGIAAGLAILIGSYFIMIEKRVEEGMLASEEYTVDDARLAYEEARNALLMVSQVMNKGTAKLEPLSKMTDATRELNILNKFHQGTSELQALSRFDEAINTVSTDN